MPWRFKTGHSRVKHCYSSLLPFIYLQPCFFNSSRCLPFLLILTSGFNLCWDDKRKQCISSPPLNPLTTCNIALLISQQSVMTDSVLQHLWWDQVFLFLFFLNYLQMIRKQKSALRMKRNERNRVELVCDEQQDTDHGLQGREVKGQDAEDHVWEVMG